MTFDAAERVADAVLYEGYVLYPYRASAIKNDNRMRWQFGVLAPRPPDGVEGEPWFSQTECLIEAASTDPAALTLRVRGLSPRPSAGRTTEWLEGVSRSLDAGPLPLEAGGGTHRLTLESAPAVDVLVEWTCAGDLIRVRVRLENAEPWQLQFAGSREAMLASSLVSAHVLMHVAGGAFVSLLEPPPAIAEAAAACVNVRTWPVLVGDRGRRDLMLASPIILYDYPAIAPESPSNLCDGTEIDEILSLRVLTMTDEEKAEARATDARARAIVDTVETLAPDAFDAMHGTMRAAEFFNPRAEPSPDAAFVMLGDVRVEKGTHVRLRPTRRADSMDLFLRGQAATVAGVYRDLESRVYVAVTVDADPGAALHESFGRYFYFDPDELEPLGGIQEVSS